MQEAKSGVPNRNCKSHDTIPHIISKKKYSDLKKKLLLESYQIHLKHIFVYYTHCLKYV